MILVDTSAWIEYDRATGSAAHLRVRGLLDDHEGVATTELVIAEVASGARSDARERQLRQLLGRCRLVPLQVPGDLDGGARLYRACRQHGVTPRNLADCVIATVAVRSGASLLARDADFVGIASVTNLRLDLSPGP